MLRWTLPAGIALLWTSLALAQPTEPNLPYGPHARQKLDLYLPAGAGPFPLVVWIHGGAWLAGDKYPCGKAGILLDAGFAVASVNYRLSQDATFPAQIHDCKGAIRWLRAHAAQYRIDPSRVGSWGSSAGGHLSALVGTGGGVPELEGEIGGNLAYSSRVQAAADYFGPTNFFTMGGSHDDCNSPESRLLGACLRDIKEHINDPNWAYWVNLTRLASPWYQVTPEEPPFHIAHGTADGTVPPSQSQELYDALIVAGVPATLRMVPGAGHGLPVSEDNYVRDFFLTHLSRLPHRGDLNGDGAVNFDDINPFVLALTGETEYLRQYPRANWYNADVNADGRVNFDDINPFVELLGGGG
ncbi:MAG: alpha/beta hydrolase fold domain-containing protein [Planctomycetota bacterium]